MAKHLELLSNQKDNTDLHSTPSDENHSAILTDCTKVCKGLTSTLLLLANEPSLAYYRIQEHTRKAMPTVLKERAEAQRLNSKLKGACFDLDYAVSTLNSSSRALSHLVRLNELLKSGLFTKLQLDCEEKFSPHIEVGIDLVSVSTSDLMASLASSSRSSADLATSSVASSASLVRALGSSFDSASHKVETAEVRRRTKAPVSNRAELTLSADVTRLADITIDLKSDSTQCAASLSQLAVMDEELTSVPQEESR